MTVPACFAVALAARDLAAGDGGRDLAGGRDLDLDGQALAQRGAVALAIASLAAGGWSASGVGSAEVGRALPAA